MVNPAKTTESVVQAQPKVVNTAKRVKEEIIRWDSPIHNYAVGEIVEQELFQGSGMTYYTVRIGEGVELLSLGTANKAGATWQTGGTIPGFTHFDQLIVQDFNGAEWNKFHIVPTEQTAQASNTLPFNRMVNFERQMMSWGYKSFLSTNKDIAPTLKLPEGDKLRVFLRNSQTGAFNITGTSPRVPTCAITRRYLPGSDIDYKHFDQYDGGIRSQKRYYEDYQTISATTPGTDTEAWNLTIIRNEAYKFFQAGVLGASSSTATNLVGAKIMIDDPLTEYNKYYVSSIANNLPFTDTYANYVPGTTPAITYHDQTHRFAPTIDVLKNRNKDLKMYIRDNGTNAGIVTTRFYGIRYIL